MFQSVTSFAQEVLQSAAKLFVVAYDTVGQLGLALDIGAFIILVGFIYHLLCQTLILRRWTKELESWEAELVAQGRMLPADHESVVRPVEEQLAQGPHAVPQLHVLKA